VKLEDLAWHRTVGRLIDRLDHATFWTALVRAVSDYVPCDSWVALLFYPDRAPLVLAEQPTESGGVDELFQDYLNGLYLLDPFYIASRESQEARLVRLDDVAPDRFRFTDYYQRYFRLNIVEDEIQFNQPLEEGRTLSLSLGAAHRFSPEAIETLSLIQPWVTALLRQRWHVEMALKPSQAAPIPQGRQADLEASISHWNGASLTARELEVGRLMLSGYSSKAIAQKLAISVETVRVHKKHIYAKLGINSQSELFSIFLYAQQQ
jgi:DNA-binding CsgD family transcriptional regulator